jgi:hypothetical protein
MTRKGILVPLISAAGGNPAFGSSCNMLIFNELRLFEKAFVHGTSLAVYSGI